MGAVGRPETVVVERERCCINQTDAPCKTFD
jgi:hypothetical protein